MSGKKTLDGPVKLVEKHRLATRWHHWINFPVLGIMVWSGLLIYWANDIYSISWGGKEYFHFFPDPVYKGLQLSGKLALGMAWHLTFMWFFFFNGLLYVIFTFRSGAWKELYPGKRSLIEAIKVVLYDIGFRRGITLPDVKYNAAQRISYSAIIFMGAGSLWTGLAIYKPVQFGWVTWLCGGYEVARAIHFILTLGYCAFFLVHIAQVIRAGWNNFRGMLTGYELVPAGEAATVEGAITNHD